MIKLAGLVDRDVKQRITTNQRKAPYYV
jgi:hypothetical protein